MSVSIRLAKFGKRHAPTYRVVVTKTRNKRNGEFIDIIGNYNPGDPNQGFSIKKEIYEDWVGKGAIVSTAVKQLIEGTYEYKKYIPKKSEGKEDEESPKKGPEEKEVEIPKVEEPSQTEEPVEEVPQEKE